MKQQGIRDASGSELTLENFIRCMPGAVVALDMNGCVICLNHEAARLFPDLERAPPAKSLWSAVPFLSRYKQAFLDVSDKGRAVEFQRETWDNQVFRVSIFPFTPAEKGGAVIKLDNITEQEKIQAHVMQSRKMDAIGSLVGGLAHDFNNILNGMMMTLDYLKQYVINTESGFSREDVEEEMEILSSSVKRASDLVQQLLTISSRKAAEAVSFDLSAAVDRVVETCRQSFDKSVEISVTLPKNPALILGDKAQIEQAILDVCVNASHAMTIMRGENKKWGGVLSVEVSPLTPGKAAGGAITEASAGQFWCLSIADTGVGMDEKTMEKIFEPFFSAKESGKGSGLGLSRVYGIVKRSHGHITVQSEPGKGSVFRIFFPAEHRQASASSVQ